MTEALNTRTSRRFLYLLPAMLLIAAAWFLFKDVASFRFINWDDNYLVYKNPDILSIGPGSALRWFTSSYVNLFTPLSIFSFALEHHFYGLWPGGYHVTNLLIHIANAVLVYFLLVRLTKDPAVAFLGALLFAVHPAQIQSVAWISERKNLLCALFLLFAGLTALSFGKRSAVPYIFAGLALLSSPLAITAPALVLLYLWDRGETVGLRQGLGPLLALTAAVLAAAGISLFFHPITAGLLSRSSPADILARGTLSYFQYWKIAAWPQGLHFFYPKPDQAVYGIPRPAVIALTLAILAVFAAALRQRKKSAFWFFAITVLLLPASGFLGVPCADRHWYLPLAALTPFLYEVFRPVLPRKIILVLLGCLILAVWPVSQRALPVWRDSGTFWLKILSDNPREDRALKQLAGYYAETGDTGQLAAVYDRILALDPYRADVYTEYATFAAKTGNLALIDKIAGAATQYCPDKPETFYILAMSANQRGQTKSVTDNLEKAAELKSQNPAVYMNLAGFYLGRTATTDAERVVSLFEKNIPGHAESLYLRGLIDLKKADLPGAERWFVAADKKGSRNPTVYYYLGILELQKNRRKEAVFYLKKALALQPDYAQAQRALIEAEGRKKV